MKLIDRLGVKAVGIDKKLLSLVGSVETVNFSDVLYTSENLDDKLIIGNKVSLHDTYYFVNQFGLNYLVQSQHDHFIYNLIMASIIIKYPDSFREHPLPTIIGSSKSDPDRTLQIPFNSSENKNEIMTRTKEFLQKHKRLESLENNITLITNEFLMNALYCAPVDNNETPLYINSDRLQPVEYEKNKKGQIYLSFNDNTLVVGCRDPFGSVDQLKVKARLNEVFKSHRKAKVELNKDRKGGSGLGLKMVIENSTGFGMVVKKRTETFAFATLPLGQGSKTIYAMAKNLFLNFY